MSIYGPIIIYFDHIPLHMLSNLETIQTIMYIINKFQFVLRLEL